MRAHGRQGSCSHRPACQGADRRPARRRRQRGAAPRRRPHRRQLGDTCSPATSTRADRPFCTGERTDEGFFEVEAGLDSGHRPGTGLRAIRRPDLVRDVAPRSRRGGQVRRSHPCRVPRQDARLQLLAVVQLAAVTSTTTRSPASRRSSARWGTSSSSSPSPGSTPSTCRCSNWPPDTAEKGCRLRPAPGAGVLPRGRWLHRHPPPEGGRGRLLRPGGDGHRHRQRVDARSGRIHRRGAILSGPGRLWSVVGFWWLVT